MPYFNIVVNKSKDMIYFNDLPEDLQQIIRNKGQNLHNSIYYVSDQNPLSNEWILKDEFSSDARMFFVFKFNGKKYKSIHELYHCGNDVIFEFDENFSEVFLEEVTLRYYN